MTAAIITALIITALIIMVACTAAIIRALAAPRPVDTAALEATESRLVRVQEALAEAVTKVHALDREADDLSYALEGGGMIAEAVDDALKVGFDIDDHFDRYELQSEIESDIKCELGDMVGGAIRDALSHEIKEAIEEAIEEAIAAPLDRLKTIERAFDALLNQRAAERAVARATVSQSH